MLNAIATEALYSATYVDNYIESVDHVPDYLQRIISRIREIDVQYRNLLRDVDHYYDLCHAPATGETSETRRQRAVMRMHSCLVRAQELGDEKMLLVHNMQELIDHKTRQMETDKENLDIREDLEQLQLGQLKQEGDEVPTPAKQMRTQSPAGMDAGAMGAANTGSAVAIERMLAKESGAAFISCSTSGAAGGRATPNLEASVVAVDAVRGNNKRSRRRNDTANNQIMEFANESNSANEGGSNGGERPTTSRTLSVGSQKKGAAQPLVGAGSSTSGTSSGNTSGAGANVSGSGAAGGGSTGKKKKRKARQTSSQAQTQANTRDDTPPMETIDPDEPTYCVCNQISFGEMILCDNDLCPIEWFHFSCVSLVLKPKGKWYCPNCRGDRPNIMKPKAQFLKELERYNKEKEEKT